MPNVPDQIQALIREERARLDQELTMNKSEVSTTRDQIANLKRQCSHPHGTIGVWRGYPAFDCPDCGYGYLDMRGPKPSYRRRKRKV